MSGEDHPTPDAGAGKTTKREVTIRDGDGERTWVEWYVGNGGSFTTIYDETDVDKRRMISADLNELDKLLSTLQQAKSVLSTGGNPGQEIVRDITIERVLVEWDSDFTTISVEQMGEHDRLVLLDLEQLGKLISALEQAKDELPTVEMDAHVN